jgi:hypothetical protein
MRRFVVLAIVVVGLVGCAGSSGTSLATSDAVGPSSSAVAASSASPSGLPTSSPVITPIPGCLPDCVEPNLVRPGSLPAGDYTTQFFFGGHLTVTIPDGWTSFEDSTGEFALRPEGTEDRAVLFWIDVYPIVDGTFEPVAGFDGTAKAMVAWIEANPNITVIEKGPGSLGGLEATTLEFLPSDEAVNVDPGCPPEVQPCVGLLSFPQWRGEFFSQGGPFHEQLVAVDATWGGESHAVYVMIDAANEAAFREIEPAAMEMIESARLPAGVSQ